MAVVPLAARVARRAAASPAGSRTLGAAGLVASADLVRFAPALDLSRRAAVVAAVAVVLRGRRAAWTLWRRRARVTGSAEPTRPSVRRASAPPRVAAASGSWSSRGRSLAARGDGRLHVTFIDVGQGDCGVRAVSARLDAARRRRRPRRPRRGFDIGDRVVAPVLRDAGVRRLDYLALTHGDPDHIGGARVDRATSSGRARCGRASRCRRSSR